MYSDSTHDLTQVDINSSKFKANPFDFYAQLRHKSPIFMTKLNGKLPVALVTRYEDVKALFTDDRFLKNMRNVENAKGFGADAIWMPAFIEALQNNMLDMDGADHNRLRHLVHKAFTPRRIQEIEGRIETLAYEYVAKARANGNQIDLIKDYALPIPATVIAEILGIPASDMDKFHRWSANLVQSNAASIKGMLKLIPAAWQFVRYIRKQLETRRENPQDDLLTALVEAEEAGDSLNNDEAVAMVMLMLIAGHETTVNLIASGTLALLQHPDQLARFRTEPAIRQSAIEELLRFTVPVETATERYATEDVTWHGVTIPQGTLTLAVIASANRDETVFENPNTLDLTRTPNRHLSLGHGLHYCLGAPLARMEGAIALNVLLAELPNLELAQSADTLEWHSGMVLRGLKKLPVRF